MSERKLKNVIDRQAMAESSGSRSVVALEASHVLDIAIAAAVGFPDVCQPTGPRVGHAEVDVGGQTLVESRLEAVVFRVALSASIVERGQVGIEEIVRTAHVLRTRAG